MGRVARAWGVCQRTRENDTTVRRESMLLRDLAAKCGRASVRRVALDGRECRRGRDEADTASLPKRKLIKCNQGLIQSRRLRQLRRLRARHSVGERGKTWSVLAWVDFDWSGR